MRIFRSFPAGPCFRALPPTTAARHAFPAPAGQTDTAAALKAQAGAQKCSFKG